MSEIPTPTICVDASFIVRLFVPDRFSTEAETLWQNWSQSSAKIVAPTLLLFEVSATLRRMVFHKHLSPRQGNELFHDFNQLNIFVSHNQSILARAWELAQEFAQQRTYDMTYLAYAEQNDCPFWTADERLYNSVRHKISWIHWLGELQDQ
jgi:predicted nucleic acid-binding protein